MNVTLPNGVVIEDIPEGTGKWEIAYKAINKGLAKEEDFPELNFNSKEMVKNIPRDAGEFASGMFQSAVRPIETAKSLVTLGASGLADIADRLGWKQPEETLAPAKQLRRELKGKYGNSDNFLDSLQEHPVQTAADLAMALGGAGSVTRAAGLPTVGRAINLASNLVDPVANSVRAARVAGQTAMRAPGLRSIPERLYQSGTRFNDLDLSREALRRGIDPSRPIDEIIRDKQAVGRRLGEMVDAADQRMASAPGEVLMKGVDEIRGSISNPGIRNIRQARSLDRFINDMRNQLGMNDTQMEILDANGNRVMIPGNPQGRNVPAYELQQFKRDAWKQLYGTSKNRVQNLNNKAQKDPTTRAERLVSRNAADALDNIIGDEYRAANREYGTLKDLVEELTPIRNRLVKGEHANVILPSGAGGAVGYSMGGRLGALVGSLAAIGATKINTPGNRIRSAISLDRLRNSGPVNYLGVTAPNLGKYGAVSNTIEEERLKKIKKLLGLL